MRTAVTLNFGTAISEFEDRKSTRLNSSHSQISYAVFCLKTKKQRRTLSRPRGSSTRRSYDLLSISSLFPPAHVDQLPNSSQSTSTYFPVTSGTTPPQQYT